MTNTAVQSVLPVPVRAQGARSRDFWNDERDEHLLRLRREGVSNSQIAKEVGASRSAVLGRFFRMKQKGIELPETSRSNMASHAGSAPKKPRRSAPTIATGAVLSLPFPEIPTESPAGKKAAEAAAEAVRIARRLTVAGLKEDTCRWPMLANSDHGQHVFCGAKVQKAPYCEHHRKIAYLPPQPKGRKS